MKLSDDYREYLQSFNHEEERIASKERFNEALADARHLLALLSDACIEHDAFRDAATTMLESYAVQLRALERACRRSSRMDPGEV